MKYYKLVILALLCTIGSHAQVNTFMTSYEMGSYGGLNNFLHTADGGFVIASYYRDTMPGPSQDTWALVAKVDSQGDTQWVKEYFKYNGPKQDDGISVCEGNDHGFLIVTDCGYFDSTLGMARNAMCLIKTDTSGNVVWSQLYRGLGWSHGYRARTTSDGGFVICGSTSDTVTLQWYGFVVRVDSVGTVVFSTCYNNPVIVGDENFYSVSETQNGDFVACGNGTIIRMNSAGAVLWAMDAGNNQNTYDIIELSGGDLLCVGRDLLMETCVFYRLDAGGNSIWTKMYFSGNSMWSYSILPTWDGFSFVADGDPGPQLANGARLFHMDHSGNMLWGREYPLANCGDVMVTRTSDGGYAMGTFLRDWSYYLYSQQVILKTDSLGGTACYSLPVTEVNGTTGQLTAMPYVPINAPLIHSIQIATLSRNSNDTLYCSGEPDGQMEFSANTESVLIFPNPTNDIVTVSTELSLAESTRIRLCDITGRTVYEDDLRTNVQEINLSNLQSGIYFLLLERDGIVTGQKQIIRK